MQRGAKVLIGFGFVLMGIGTAVTRGGGDFSAGRTVFVAGFLLTAFGLFGGSLFTASEEEAQVSPFGMKLAAVGFALAVIPAAISVLLRRASDSDVESIFKFGVAVMIAGLIIHFVLLLRSKRGG